MLQSIEWGCIIVIYPYYITLFQYSVIFYLSWSQNYDRHHFHISYKILRNTNVRVTHFLLGESSKNWVTSHLLLRWSRNSLYFMDSVDIVPCLQQAASGLSSELYKFIPRSHSCSSEIHFNMFIIYNVFLDLQGGSLSSGFITKVCMPFGLTKTVPYICVGKAWFSFSLHPDIKAHSIWLCLKTKCAF
jgi:hypothetical protein